MNEELSLREIINEVILFFIKFWKLIISVTIAGMLLAIVFQKTKPAFYKTTAIATSGISVFERIQDDREVMNQRTAINLINNLQAYVKKEDYLAVANRLNILEEEAALIKDIKAEQIYREGQEGKKFNTPKFEINLIVKNNEVISAVESGLFYYFNNNDYIKSFYENYLATNNQVIEEINKEVIELKTLRGASDAQLNMSSTSILSRKGVSDVQNQIVELVQMRSVNETNQKLLKPLAFVQNFTVTQVAERGVLMLASLAGIISFIISIIIAVFRNVRQNMIKE